MSAEAVAARVSEIQGMIAALRGQGATTGGATPPSSSFASALQSASGPVATAASTTGGAGDSTPYDSLIADAAQRNGVDPALLKGLIRQESNFDPTAHSGAGAV